MRVGFLDFLSGRNRLPVASDLTTWQVPAGGVGLTATTVTLANLYPGIDPDNLPVSRAESQTVPAVMAIQNLLTSSMGSLPLQTVDASGTPLATQPQWVTRCDAPGQSVLLRQTRTIKDLLYNGISLWLIDAKDGRGYPLSMSHVALAPDQWDGTGRYWRFDDLNRGVIIGQDLYDFSSVVIFPGTFEGLLNVGARTIRAAVSIERTLLARSRTAIPTQVLKNLGDGSTEPTDDEIQALLKAYSDDRRSINGTTVYVPGGYDLRNLKDSSDNFLLEARNALTGDFAKMTGVPSGLIEGTSSIDSLSYTTELGQLARFIDLNLKTYTDPITARLSMGDVTPRTQTVRFDLSDIQTESPEPLTDKGTPSAPNTDAKEPADD